MRDFTFEIGSFVRLAISESQKHSESRWGEDSHCEMRGHIVNRFLDECPGGIQRHYDIRWTNFNGACLNNLSRHNEIELVASEAFPAAEDKKD